LSGVAGLDESGQRTQKLHAGVEERSEGSAERPEGRDVVGQPDKAVAPLRAPVFNAVINAITRNRHFDGRSARAPTIKNRRFCRAF
jgi:hypothetical protein